MQLALYQPEIAGNVGAVLRLAACFGVTVNLIEPLGFGYSDKRLKRAGMDYLDHVEVVRHPDWHTFYAQQAGRVVLMTTKADVTLYDFTFAPSDILLCGSESAGVPESVHNAVAASLRIPMRPVVRSLNLGIAAGIALTEALRQTHGLPQ